jgi:hypothetical protein
LAGIGKDTVQMKETSRSNGSTGIKKKFENFLHRDATAGSAQGLLGKM